MKDLAKQAKQAISGAGAKPNSEYHKLLNQGVVGYKNKLATLISRCEDFNKYGG